MKTLTSFSGLREVKQKSFNREIGEQFGKLIKAIKKMPCSFSMERGKLSKVKLHNEKEGYFMPFISQESKQVSLCFVSTSPKKFQWEEWTVDEFIQQYGSFKKSA